jgi:hypothetical protein
MSPEFSRILRLLSEAGRPPRWLGKPDPLTKAELHGTRFRTIIA